MTLKSESIIARMVVKSDGFIIVVPTIIYAYGGFATFWGSMAVLFNPQLRTLGNVAMCIVGDLIALLALYLAGVMIKYDCNRQPANCPDPPHQ